MDESTDQPNPYDAPRVVDARPRPLWIVHAVNTVAVLLGLALVVLIVFGGPVAWLMRDGLGPDSTTSSGMAAVARMFWCFYWGPVTAATGLAAGATYAIGYRLRFVADDT